MTNDGAHICTRPSGPFVLEPKCSSMVDFQQVSFIMLFGLGGPQPQIGGWFECGVPFRVFLCYVL